MYKNFTLTESEREAILGMHQAHGYKKPLNEEVTFAGQTSGVKKTVPPYWRAVSAYLRNNPMMGFKFADFIEGIPTKGIEMKNDKGQSIFVEVDGFFDLCNSNGRGVHKSGTWRWDGSKVIMTMDTPRPVNEEMEDVDLGDRLANDSASDYPQDEINDYNDTVKYLTHFSSRVNELAEELYERTKNTSEWRHVKHIYNQLSYTSRLHSSRHEFTNHTIGYAIEFITSDNAPQEDEMLGLNDEMPTHAEDAYNSAMKLGKSIDYYRGGGYEDLSGRDD
jgi:hypothetical protein